MSGNSWGTRNRYTPRDKATILDRDEHICQLQYHGCTWQATVVDHRIPLSRWPGDPRDLDNGQAVCASCHDRKTKAESAAGRQAAAAARRDRLKRPSARSTAQHPGDW